MPHRNPLRKALARINTKTSAAPAFQPPFKDRPPLPVILITSSSATPPTSPVIHNSPFPPNSAPPIAITPSPPQSPIQPGHSPTSSPISPLTPPPTTTASPFSPPTNPETIHPNLRPEHHLEHRYLRTLALLLTPAIMRAAQSFLADHGYGTGPHGTVTEADEVKFFETLDAFLCILDPNAFNSDPSVGAIDPTAESSGKKYWPEGLDEVGSRYLEKLMRGLDAERACRVGKWVGVATRGRGFGEYVTVVDGLLGVLEGRKGKVMVEEGAMMRGALMESTGEGVEERLRVLKDGLMWRAGGAC